MAINIEKKEVSEYRKQNEFMQDFLVGIRDMNVGQSFTVKKMSANHRSILAAMKTLMGRRYACRTEGNKIRIGRTK